MIKKMKFLLSVLVLTLSVSSAQARLFGTAVAAATGAAGGTATGIGPVPGAIAGVGAAKFAKKHPILTTIAVGVGGTVAYQKSTIHIARDLSYHLEKVDPYFRENPEKFDEITNYVRNALAHPANKNDYDRYERLAVNMGLGNIPPYIPVGSNGQTVYENPIQEVNNGDNIYINPSNTNAGGENIIYTPQGKAIDTSTEFPHEPITNWQDYILVKQHSKDLSDDMIANRVVREKDTAAHHLLPATHPLAQRARDILEKYSNILGVNAFNNAINGAFLPTNNSSKQSGIIHNGKHPDNYVRKINQIIIDADNAGGLPMITQELDRVRGILQNPPLGVTWSNIL